MVYAKKDRYPYNFNSHAHVERDLAMFSVVDLFANFNSHAHVERDNYIG